MLKQTVMTFTASIIRKALRNKPDLGNFKCGLPVNHWLRLESHMADTFIFHKWIYNNEYLP